MNALATYLADRTIKNRNALLLENKGLIYAICKSLKVPYPEIADAFHVGVIGMARAIDMFDPTKGDLSAWLGYWVRVEIRDKYVTTEARGTSGRPGRKKGAEHNLRVYGAEDQIEQSEGANVDPEQVIRDKQLLAELRRIPMSLMERQILVQHMAGDKDLMTLSRESHMPYTHYYRTKTRLQHRLRKALSQ